MKKIHTLTLAAVFLLPASLHAQHISPEMLYEWQKQQQNAVADPSLAKPRKVKAAQQRPDHWNNAETIYFPPIFNQDGGSCEQAAKIGYQFTYELNTCRRADGKLPQNQLPTHFTWYNYFCKGGAPEMAVNAGIPNVPTYGGRTYSKLIGNNFDWRSADAGWMTGYEKWYSAMFNRASRVVNFPVSVRTEEGREAVKQFLWNHNGDETLPSGGVVGIGLAAVDSENGKIPSTAANREAGAVGKYYVKHWGPTFDHAMTIVGYDDRLEFDLDGNGKAGEEDKDERGAWILANSWGEWCNDGFIYCPYKYGVYWCNEDGSVPSEGTSWTSDPYWTPTLYEVRRDYRPLRTIKVLMDYSHRSELYLTGGISADLDAEAPERSIPFHHFIYCGDGQGGDSVPTPEVPMLGRWADGHLHHEPMEFGYDLTDLTGQYDPALPLKYFFTIETKKDVSRGTGTLRAASIIDYALDEQGVEVPFDLGAEGVTIESKGKTTVVTVIVPGRGLYAPQNAVAADGVLSWQSPMPSGNTLTGYRVTDGQGQATTLPASTTFITLPESDRAARYTVTALYGTNESHPVGVDVPATEPKNQYINLTQGGFSIPDVFGTKYENATIEFWIKPHSLMNWNQSAGPGWQTFMFHANANGTFTAGWDAAGNRLEIPSTLAVNQWTHIAIVVRKNVLELFVNGQSKGSLTSQKYSGIGGFGELRFRNDGTNAQDAVYDELRIWNKARTTAIISSQSKIEFGEAGQPDGLLAYYKGDLITVGGQTMLRDHSGHGHHATLLDTNYACEEGMPDLVKASTSLTKVSINEPQGEVVAGQPVTLTATASAGAHKMVWTAEGAGIKNLETLSPTLIFKEAGQHTVSVSAGNDKKTVSAETVITVLPAPAPDATFTVNAPAAGIAASDHVSFLVSRSVPGHSYLWQMPGADVEEARTPNAAATYNDKGTYTVTLTVTAPDGRTATHSEQIDVRESTPLAAFEVQPAVVVKGETTRLADRSKYAPTGLKWELQSPQTAMTGEGSVLVFRPAKPGIYDVTLTATNAVGTSTATEKGALVVCNADSRNGLTFTSDAAHIELARTPLPEGQKAFTIEWWMNASSFTPACNGIGQDNSTLLITTGGKGAMTLHLKGKSISTGDEFVIPGSWHHYAVDLSGVTARFYRDGELMKSGSVGASGLPAMTSFRIGTDEAPMKGQIDELRIWGKRFTAAKLQSYINQPIADVAAAEADDELLLYYDFNQNGGDVRDATGNANTGRRVGFGPDGDAWGLSRGVFCLNLDDKPVDITKDHLVNYRAPYANTGKVINPINDRRFLGLTGWTLENTGNNGTGAHVDAGKDNYLTITTQWDDFAPQLTDHKLYQTISLPAGAYRLTTDYGGKHGQATGTYLVAAKGSTLPVTGELDRQALAYTEMQEISLTQTNSITFVLTEDSEVSLGILSNMSGMSCMTIRSFTLESLGYEAIVSEPDAIGLIPETARRDGAVYDLTGNRVLTPRKGGIYIINGQKVMIR